MTRTTLQPLMKVSSVLLVLLLVGLSASAVAAQDYKETFNDARSAAEAKDYQTAYTKYQAAATGARQASDQEVLNMANKVLAQLAGIFGSRALKQENTEQAKEYFEAGIGYNPTYAKNHYNLGLTLKMMDDFPGAIAAWQKAVEVGNANGDRKTANTAATAIRDNLYYDASSRLSKARPSSADADAAIAALENAKNFVEPDADWHYYMGLAQRAKGQSQAALASFNQALELHRGSRGDKSKIHYAAGELYLEMGNNAQALSHLEQCVGQYRDSAQDTIQRYNLKGTN